MDTRRMKEILEAVVKETYPQVRYVKAQRHRGLWIVTVMHVWGRGTDRMFFASEVVQDDWSPERIAYTLEKLVRGLTAKALKKYRIKFTENKESGYIYRGWEECDG